MAALRSRCGHYIFVLVSSSLSSFFPRLISAVADWMSTILPHMMRPYSANLECRSEMFTWLAEIQEAKNRQLGTIAQFCLAISLQLRPVSTILKKVVKQQDLLHLSLQW